MQLLLKQINALPGRDKELMNKIPEMSEPDKVKTQVSRFKEWITIRDKDVFY